MAINSYNTYTITIILLLTDSSQPPNPNMNDIFTYNKIFCLDSKAYVRHMQVVSQHTPPDLDSRDYPENNQDTT